MIQFILLMVVLGVLIVTVSCFKVSSTLSREEEEHEENNGRIKNSFTETNR